MATSMRRLVELFAVLAAVTRSDAYITDSLDGEWIARETYYWYEFKATVPGGVYTDLMNIGLIEDVFYEYNENLTRWVGEIDWTYTRNFTVEAETLKYNEVNLVFEGVDTFATVVVNDVTVGTTQNMFVKYVFDVKDALKVGNNNITIHFKNSPQVGLELNNEQLKKYRIPWECPPDEYRGVCHINMIRKMQASFSWDWGPALPSIGLWKPVYIEAFNESLIRYVVPTVVDSDSDNWQVNIDTYLANNDKKSVTGTLRVTISVDNNEEISQNFDVNENANANGEIIKSVSISIAKNQVKLWWPNGYGAQPLYQVKVDFTDEQNADQSSKNIKIGFRTVELVEDDLQNGATFYFKINGVPIFAKGSNEIPVNILPELGQDPQKVRYLLQSSKDVNMNMLRVWGGGVYESDYFYEVADELGIMIWQDFMFACSLYPAEEDFLDNVAAEVNHNVKRIYHHPSIVIYSGNNENEGVLVDNWYGTQDNYEQYKKDYVQLYIATIRSEFNRITRNQGVYISSSPTNGKMTEREGWIGQSPSNQLWGDMHYYNYILDPWDSNTYPVPRFCSEYGYQSLPFEDSWYTATNNTADLDISGHFMDTRQHHPMGNGEMSILIAENLNLPNRTSEYFMNAYIYLSQVYTSQAIKVETEHYRRYRSYLDEEGRGYTMGALYWQLNDVWVAPTWAGIDFTGRWKMLHYFAKDMFANIIVTGHINYARELQLYTVNDQLNPVDDVSVVVRVYKYDSPDFKPVYENRIAHTLDAGASQLIQTIQTDDFLKQQNCDKNTCFFHFVVQKNSSLTTSVDISPENYVFPGKLKDSSLPSSNVQISSVTQTNSDTYEVTVTSDNIALFVWLDSHDVRGRFSENGFQQVGSSKTIWFHSDEDTTVEELRNALTVTHIKDPRWA